MREAKRGSPWRQVIGLLPLLCLGAPEAAEPKWKAVPYTHTSQDEPVRDLLTDFAARNGMASVVSRKITERVSGHFEGEDPKAFMEKMASAYGLAWYYDGSALYVTRNEDNKTKVLALPNLPLAKLTASLKDMDIWDSRYPVRAAKVEGLVYVSGPPRYVDLVAQAASQLDGSEGTEFVSPDKQSVKVFPLRHAWAGDVTFSLAGHETVVPGVATLLNGLMGRESHPPQARRGGTLQVEAVPGLALQEGSEGSPGLAPQSGPGPRPGVQADLRTNSVIVRDTRENMPRYQALISALDVPAGMIEINASIIDVNSGLTRDLGLEWQYRENGTVNGQSHSSGVGQTFSDLQNPNGGPPALLDGLSFATLALGSRTAFLARLRALEVEGKASIAARPTVLTFENLEARIGQHQIFHVRVSGEREANLFRIQSGTVLSVTPHILDEGEGLSIKLAVQIEDGGFDGNGDGGGGGGAGGVNGSVDNIPVVSQSVITTQATVGDQESLLLGGFIRTEVKTVFSKVPLLGSIPLLKYLFSKSTKVKTRMERIFMITPKVVRSGADAGFGFELDDTEKARLSEIFPGIDSEAKAPEAATPAVPAAKAGKAKGKGRP